MNFPKEARWVIGSYVNARAVWPPRGTPAASSEPGWPPQADGWGGGPRPRSPLRRPSALGWTAPWPGPEVTGGHLVLRRGGGGSGPSSPPLRTWLGWKIQEEEEYCYNDQHGQFCFHIFCLATLTVFKSHIQPRWEEMWGQTVGFHLSVCSIKRQNWTGHFHFWHQWCD